jgi:hypothetical protein
MPKGFHVVCLEPGADNPKKHTPPPEPEPPEGFVDNTVKVFRLNPDGSKGEFLGTMPPFPEGWDDPAKRKMTPGSGRRDKEEDEDMGRPKREAPPADELRRLYEKHNGKINRIARSLGTNWLRTKQWLIEAGIIEEQQTPEPKPAEAGNQEPVQESQEPAGDSVAQGAPFDEAAFNPDKPEITVKDVLQYELAQKEQHTLPQIWTESDKQLARKLKEDGLSMRQIADAMGFTYRQVKGFFERERAKQRKPNQNDVLSKYKVKWIRDVMLDDLDPGVQLRIVAAVQGLEI